MLNAPLQWLKRAAEFNDEVNKMYIELTGRSGGCTSCSINAAVAKARKLLAGDERPEVKQLLAALESKPSTGTVSLSAARTAAMHCPDCLRKHLAAALSYGKEILNGHGKDGSPDHRPDFAGEVINAEHHAEAIDAALATALRELRHSLDAAAWTPDITMLDRIRELWMSASQYEKEV